MNKIDIKQTKNLLFLNIIFALTMLNIFSEKTYAEIIRQEPRICFFCSDCGDKKFSPTPKIDPILSPPPVTHEINVCWYKKNWGFGDVYLKDKNNNYEWKSSMPEDWTIRSFNKC